MNKFDKFRFEDTEVAFADKNNPDLRRMFLLFCLMNNTFLMKLGMKIMRFCLSIHLPIVFLIKKTLFKQFCGGESLQDSKNTVLNLGKSHIYTILDYSVEGESDEKTFDHNKEEIIRSIMFAAQHEYIPIGVMKLTAFVRFNLLRKRQEGIVFTEKEELEWETFYDRVDDICTCAVAQNKTLFIDAEETWIQEPIDAIVNEMMKKYNSDKIYIYNTYQMYRKAAFDKLKAIHASAKVQGFKIGAKIVRGAYLEKERQRAEAMLYEDPIHGSKGETDQAYNDAMVFCMENIDVVSVCVGTHNEDSSVLATELMNMYHIDKRDDRVVFAQLYGMSDNISYALSNGGYNVAKYVPYGPVKKVIPYLMRRTEENTSISGQSSRELLLVKGEMKRRKTSN